MKYKIDLQILRIIIVIIIGALFATSALHLVAIFKPQESISEITKSLFFNNYFPKKSFTYPLYAINIYLTGNCILFFFLGYKLIIAFKIIQKTIQNKIFYSSQANDIIKIANSIITFAQLKLLLILLCGSFYFMAPFKFVSFLATFTILYILGKVLVFFGEVVKKGQLLKEDIDLTI